MAAEFTLVSVYTVRTEGRMAGGADKGWVQLEWAGTSFFLQGRARAVPTAVALAQATLVPDGVSSSALWREHG